MKEWYNQFDITLAKEMNFSASCIFWTRDWTTNNELSISWTKSILKDFSLTSKEADGYIGPVASFLIRGDVFDVENIHSDTHERISR